MKNVDSIEFDLFTVSKNGGKQFLTSDQELHAHLSDVKKYDADRPAYYELRLGNTEINLDIPVTRMTANPLA